MKIRFHPSLGRLALVTFLAFGMFLATAQTASAKTSGSTGGNVATFSSATSSIATTAPIPPVQRLGNEPSICAASSDLCSAAKGGATATADVAKFSNYAFVTDKAPVFESYGYTAEDSQQLADLYEQQAAEKYASGDFTKGKLDKYGQRITIQIDLPGQGAAAGRSTILNTGWMIEPGGSICLITPFAGFGK